MTLSIRHFLRQLTPALARSLFDHHAVSTPAALWKFAEPKLAAALAEHLVALADGPPQDASARSLNLLADIARCHPLVSERGAVAMGGAANGNDVLLAALAGRANVHERAVYLLIEDVAIFKEAEERLFFDYYAEGSRGCSYNTAADHSVRRSEDAATAFCTAVNAFYRKLNGTGISSAIETIDRSDDKSVQVSVYVQGLPSNTVEIQDGKFKRQVSNPAVQAAIVYVPKTGHTTTVAKGGKQVHVAILEAFMRFLLGVDPKYIRQTRRDFKLGMLNQNPGLEPLTELGVAIVRVRKLKLARLNGVGLLTVEAPAGSHTISVYDMGDAWLANGRISFQQFRILHATIALHYAPTKSSKRSRTLNIELSWPNSSNLKNMVLADREVAEAHIGAWKLQEAA